MNMNMDTNKTSFDLKKSKLKQLSDPIRIACQKMILKALNSNETNIDQSNIVNIFIKLEYEKLSFEIENGC